MFTAIPFVLVVFIISFLVLARSSTLLVNSLTSLARILKMSEYTIAFLLMSAATSISELFIGISSAAENVPNLSLGDIFGANLLNISLVVGTAAFLARGLRVESKILRRDFWFIFFLGLIPFLLGMDGVISRVDGITLIIGFFAFIGRAISDREHFSKIYNDYPLTGTSAAKEKLRQGVWFSIGMLMLIASSVTLVWAARSLALAFSFKLLSFGIVFVALGSTLPELAFGIRAAISKHGSMTVGNALGSIAFNSAFVVGIVSIIHPIFIEDPRTLMDTMIAFIVMFLIFNIFGYTREYISRKEAVILIGVYIIFIFATFI